jgi:hypothetical protein
MADNYDKLFQAFIAQADRMSIPREEQAKYVKECFERLERQREREQRQKQAELEAAKNKKKLKLQQSRKS